MEAAELEVPVSREKQLILRAQEEEDGSWELWGPSMRRWGSKHLALWGSTSRTLGNT